MNWSTGSHDDKILEITIDQDFVTECFKFDRKNNLKPNMKNTLGMFELEEVYRFAHRMLADLGNIQNLVATN